MARVWNRAVTVSIRPPINGAPADSRRQVRGSGALTRGAQPERSPPRLLDQVRETLRVRHYAIRTEEAYVDWIRRFIYFHGKRHPAGMGKREVTAFLTHVAVVRHVSAST